MPPEERRALTKGQIALELLDQARAERWLGRVVADTAGLQHLGALDPLLRSSWSSRALTAYMTADTACRRRARPRPIAQARLDEVCLSPNLAP